MKDIEHNLERRNIKPTAMRLLVLEFITRHTHAVSL
jgi:Fe2+ or Zn2+ uptake regulation protein